MLPPEYGGRAVIGKHDTTGVSRTAYGATLSPAETWQIFLELLNTRSRIRLADRRKTGVAYPRRYARAAADYSDAPPAQPAAINVYDAKGFTRFIPLDLDAHERTPAACAAVEADLATVTALLDRCGLVYLSDHAHGGSHVYVLLEDPLSADEVRTLVTALARRFPTLDVLPTRSASDGLITIPGSVHKLGGHRELTTDADTARAIAAGPHSPTAAVRSLRTALAAELRAITQEDAGRGATARARVRETGSSDVLAATIPAEDIQAVIVRGIGRHMSAKCADLALTGDWRAHGYASASEARRAVLMSAIATGLTQTDIHGRLLDPNPSWPGLRSLFDHKGLHRLRDEYARAAEEIARRERTKTAGSALTRNDSAVSSDTSAPTHTGGRAGTPSAHDTHGTIRGWITLVERYAASEYTGARGWDYQMALRSLGQAASMVGSTVTAMGVRWHAVAQGDSRTDAASLLRDLAGEEDPWVALVARGRGIYANQYEIRIPDRYTHLLPDLRWRPGRTQAVRPVFTILGKPTGLFYEAIERGALTRARIALVTGLRDDAYREARETALAYGLVAGNDRDGYTIAATGADLERLAETLGAIETRTRRIHQHRQERKNYWDKLEQLRRERPWIRLVRDVEDADPEVAELIEQMYLDALDPPPAQPRRIADAG